MVVGAGGTGKTHAIKIFFENEKTDFIAPTGSASLKIGGSTIHRYLCINKDTNMASYPRNRTNAYLVIDEASMITGDIWFHLIEYKRLYPE